MFATPTWCEGFAGAVAAIDTTADCGNVGLIQWVLLPTPSPAGAQLPKCCQTQHDLEASTRHFRKPQSGPGTRSDCSCAG